MLHGKTCRRGERYKHIIDRFHQVVLFTLTSGRPPCWRDTWRNRPSRNRNPKIGQ